MRDIQTYLGYNQLQFLLNCIILQISCIMMIAVINVEISQQCLGRLKGTLLFVGWVKAQQKAMSMLEAINLGCIAGGKCGNSANDATSKCHAAFRKLYPKTIKRVSDTYPEFLIENTVETALVGNTQQSYDS